jgi:hypothetical protein
MKPVYRKILFYGLVLVFLWTASFILLLVNGFYLDAKNFKIVKTGGLFLKFDPIDATLKINDQKKDFSVGFIKSGIIIKNLPPGVYKVDITKKGWQSWEKKLTVTPGLVTKESLIKLWPENPVFEKIAENIDDFWLVNGGFIYKDKKDGVLRFQNKILKGDAVVLASKKYDFAVTTIFDSYFLVDFSKNEAALNLNKLFNSLKQQQLGLPGIVPINFIEFHPFSKDKILIGSPTSIYSLDFKKIQLEKLLTVPKIAFFTAKNDEVFAVDDAGNITVLNLILKTKKIYQNLIGLKIKNFAASSDGDNFFIITDNNELVFYNRQNQSVKKIAQGVKNFYPAPDNKRLILNMNGDHQMFYFDDFARDGARQGQKLKIITPTPLIEKITWLNDSTNQYLALESGTLYVSEVRTSPPVYWQMLAKNVRKYFFDNNSLFILQEGELKELKIK